MTAIEHLVVERRHLRDDGVAVVRYVRLMMFRFRL
jgi:hypothetical protein